MINVCIINSRTLKQALELGLKIVKIHKVLQFKQASILKPYISLNTKMRKAARDNFHKDFFKLMSNSFYGKTVENPWDYRNIQIVTNIKRFKRLSRLPNFKDVEIINPNLVIVELSQNKTLMSKPRYIGVSVLSIAKHLMYDFHYNSIIPMFNQDPSINTKVKLLMTDTGE